MALQSQLDRLDQIIGKRIEREEAEQARADASLEEARRARMRENAEQRRLIAQTYNDAYRAFGVTTPEPADDEPPSAFRKRLYNRLARRLPPDHELSQIRADDLGGQAIVFDNFEKLLLEAAQREGEHPSASNLPDDNSEVMRTHIDPATGLKTNEFFSKESFIKSMGREGRRVLRIIDPRTRSILWGRPFDQAR